MAALLAGSGAGWAGTGSVRASVVSAVSHLVAHSTHHSSAPTITSDKADYKAGSLVILTGTNWHAGEKVHISVNDTLGKTWNYSHTDRANGHGTFTDSFHLPNYFVAEYDVKAAGSSGRVATTTFTDSNITFHGPSGTVVTYTLYSGVTDCSNTGTAEQATIGASGRFTFALATTDSIIVNGSGITTGDNNTDNGTPYTNTCVSGGTGNITDFYFHPATVTPTATITSSPTSTATATITPSPTSTTTATITPSPTSTATGTITPSPTSTTTATTTSSPLPTGTVTNTPTSTTTAVVSSPTPPPPIIILTSTATATATATATRTATPVNTPAVTAVPPPPPSVIPTPVTPPPPPASPTSTATAVPATATSTPVPPAPTNTPKPKKTNTPVPPTSVPTSPPAKQPTPVTQPTKQPKAGFGGTAPGSAWALAHSHHGPSSLPRTGGGSPDGSLPTLPGLLGLVVIGLGATLRRLSLTRR